MPYAALQSALAAAGYNPGQVDDKWGAKTLAALMGFAARRQPDDVVRAIAQNLVGAMVGKDITTPLRIVHFVAQACHETGGWEWMTERGGTAYFSKYEPGRPIGRELGNTDPGDGAKYRGRGIFQITGRANYAHFGAAIGLNLLAHPETAAQPDVAARVAVAFWDGHELNALADHDDVAGITRKINGGTNGLDDRKAVLARLKSVWSM